MTQQYQVSYTIDVEAENAMAAARIAYQQAHAIDPRGHYFEVIHKRTGFEYEERIYPHEVKLSRHYEIRLWPCVVVALILWFVSHFIP
jgi:hypothetical protein